MKVFLNNTPDSIPPIKKYDPQVQSCNPQPHPTQVHPVCTHTHEIARLYQLYTPRQHDMVLVDTEVDNGTSMGSI